MINYKACIGVAVCGAVSLFLSPVTGNMLDSVSNSSHPRGQMPAEDQWTVIPLCSKQRGIEETQSSGVPNETSIEEGNTYWGISAANGHRCWKIVSRDDAEGNARQVPSKRV